MHHMIKYGRACEFLITEFGWELLWWYCGEWDVRIYLCIY